MPESAATNHSEKVASGERFSFRRNWSRFLQVLDEQRVAAAAQSMREMVGREDLSGKSSIDIGSGRGLFSLAAPSAALVKLLTVAGGLGCNESVFRRLAPPDETGNLPFSARLPERYGRPRTTRRSRQ
jgi:2-polyprenyl-6-hydroxyphenyl methylase/3-demethylubiquinone-9 3-methyltransferase